MLMMGDVVVVVVVVAVMVVVMMISVSMLSLHQVQHDTGRDRDPW